ncbi:MAG: response regulator [Anaerolineae bacterium]|nr:response regulator [Anaerolineae bacterium]
MNTPPRILIVDDEEYNTDLLAIILKNYEHITAHNARTARTILDSDPPDVLILDLMLPDLDGLSLLAQVKKNYPNLPVIILTAYGTTNRAIAAIRNGAYDFITKPFDRDVVLSSVARAVEHHRLLKEREAYTRLLEVQNAELETTREQLAAMESVALVGQMARALAHQLSSPLTTVHMTTDLIEKTEELSEQNLRRLDRIRKAAGQIHQAIDLLNMLAITPEEQMPVNLNKLLSMLIADLNDSGRLDCCQVRLSVPDTLPEVLTRPDQIWQAVRNVLLSLEQAAMEGHYEDVSIEISGRVHNDAVRLIIRQDGPGIPTYDLEEILAPLTVDHGLEPSPKGVSLGLTVARNVATANGAEFEVYSVPNDGIDVCLTLPLQASVAAK